MIIMSLSRERQSNIFILWGLDQTGRQEILHSWDKEHDMMIHPVQASATQTEIMTNGSNACYYRDRSSRTSLVTVAVTV